MGRSVQRVFDTLKNTCTVRLIFFSSRVSVLKATIILLSCVYGAVGVLTNTNLFCRVCNTKFKNKVKSVSFTRFFSLSLFFIAPATFVPMSETMEQWDKTCMFLSTSHVSAESLTWRCQLSIRRRHVDALSAADSPSSACKSKLIFGKNGRMTDRLDG